MGLDYSREEGLTPDAVDERRLTQRRTFKYQLIAARRRGLPVVIHGRDAEADLLKVMKLVLPHDYDIHRHCVTTPPSDLAPFRDHFTNARYGFTGKVTRPGREGASIRETVRSLPLRTLVAETDAPYHPPSGWRPPPGAWRSGPGGNNAHPGMVDAVVRVLAEEKQLSLREAAPVIYRNSCSLYRL